MISEVKKERLRLHKEEEDRIMERLLETVWRSFYRDNEGYVDLLNSAMSQLRVMSMLYRWMLGYYEIDPLEKLSGEEIRKRIAATANDWCQPRNRRMLIYFYRAAYVFHILFNVKQIEYAEG